MQHSIFARKPSLIRLSANPYRLKPLTNQRISQPPNEAGWLWQIIQWVLPASKFVYPETLLAHPYRLKRVAETSNLLKRVLSALFQSDAIHFS